VVIQLILIQVITFVVIIAFLRLLFGSQLKVALNRLQDLHQESLEKEEILNKELERTKIQCQGEISRSKEEAKVIVEAAKRNAEKISQEASQRVEAELKRATLEAAEKAKRLEADILAGAQQKALVLAQDLIVGAFSPKGQELLHSHFIDELIEEFKEVDKDRLAIKVDRAEVVTSLALTPEEKQKLKAVLSSKLGHELSLEEKIDPSLIIGMTIKLGGLVVDGSLKNKLNRAMVTLKMKSA
jgi:F0F1-type ATP synthase membrane subunit b/b'